MIDWQATFDLVGGALAGIASMGLVAKAIQRKLTQAPSGEPIASDSPMKGDEKVQRVYDLLKGYVTKDTCEAKHDGLCSKLDLIVKNQERFQEDFRDYRERMETKMGSLSDILLKHCSEGK